MRCFKYLAAIALGIVALTLIAGCASASSGKSPTASAPMAEPQAAPQTETKQATPTPAPPTPVVPSLKSTSITEHFKNPSGYTSSIKQTVWHPLPASLTSPFHHPLEAAATIDPSSDYDSKTDVVIPFSLKLTNTTKGFDLEKPRIAYLLEQIYSQGAPVTNLVESMSLEAWNWNADGWSKVGFTVTGNEEVNPVERMSAGPITEWSDALSPGASVTVNGFLIYHDRFTPARPKGTRRALGNLTFAVFGDGGQTDTKSLRLSLSGTVVRLR